MSFALALADARACLGSQMLAGLMIVLSGGCTSGKPLEGELQLPGDVVAIHLAPDSVSVGPSEAVDFTAIAALSDGSTGAVPVTWQASGGTITPGGRFTAGNSGGTFEVIGAYRSGLADTSTVTVTLPAITALNVAPGAVSLPVGEFQQFSASATLSNGGTLSNPPVTWTASGGTITTGGLFKAGTITGSYHIVATDPTGTVADTATVTIAPPPAPGANPHEPAGMSPAFDEAWNTSPNGRPATDWQTDTPGSNFSVVADAAAPKSHGNVLQLKFPAGMGGGGSPDHAYWNAPSQGGTGFPNNSGLLYMRIWFKVSANWTDNGNSGTKFFFTRDVAETGNHYIGLTDGGDLRPSFSTNGQFSPTPNGSGDFLISASLTKGVWHDMEVLLGQGTSAAANNGSAKIWVDGAQVLNKTGLKMLPDGARLGWSYLFYDATYGGGLAPVPADQSIWIDHWYTSVK